MAAKSLSVPPLPSPQAQGSAHHTPSTLGEELKASGETPSSLSHCLGALGWGPAFCQWALGQKFSPGLGAGFHAPALEQLRKEGKREPWKEWRGEEVRREHYLGLPSCANSTLSLTQAPGLSTAPGRQDSQASQASNPCATCCLGHPHGQEGPRRPRKARVASAGKGLCLAKAGAGLRRVGVGSTPPPWGS